MKIVRTQEKSTIDFEELLDYQVFSDIDDWIYLKIPKVVDEQHQRVVNAIDLESNSLVSFEDDDKIRILDCKLVIQN